MTCFFLAGLVVRRAHTLCRASLQKKPVVVRKQVRPKAKSLCIIGNCRFFAKKREAFGKIVEGKKLSRN
jgi:hypothetical protein